MDCFAFCAATAPTFTYKDSACIGSRLLGAALGQREQARLVVRRLGRGAWAGGDGAWPLIPEARLRLNIPSSRSRLRRCTVRRAGDCRQSRISFLSAAVSAALPSLHLSLPPISLPLQSLLIPSQEDDKDAHARAREYTHAHAHTRTHRLCVRSYRAARARLLICAHEGIFMPLIERSDEMVQSVPL